MKVTIINKETEKEGELEYHYLYFNNDKVSCTIYGGKIEGFPNAVTFWTGWGKNKEEAKADVIRIVKKRMVLTNS